MPISIQVLNVNKPSLLIQTSIDWNIYVISEFSEIGDDLVFDAFIDVPPNTNIQTGSSNSSSNRPAYHDGNVVLRDSQSNEVGVIDLVIPFVQDNTPEANGRRSIEVQVSLENMAGQNIGYVTFAKSGDPKKKAVSTNANVQPDKKK